MIRPPLAALALGSLLIGSQSLAADNQSAWSYKGASGPEHWGDVDAAYETCKNGLQQSPIDLATANAVAEIDVSVDYEPGPLTVSSGKTVQVDFPHGSYLTTSGQVFRLVQVHFHTPSEHTFTGETYPLVAHFVHVSHAGELAVLGVLFEEGAGNAELGKIIDAARSAGTEASEFPEVTLHPRTLVPEDIDVFRYMGSLTTPPCSEGVNWHVAETPLTAGADQIDAFESMMGNNARPVLPTNGRLVVAPE